MSIGMGGLTLETGVGASKIRVPDLDLHAALRFLPVTLDNLDNTEGF